MNIIKTITAILLLVWSTLPASNANLVHHDLTVKISPDRHHLQITDTIKLPTNSGGHAFNFLLHGNLTITSHSPNITIINAGESSQKKIQINHYRVQSSQPNPKETDTLNFTITYSGEIHHPPVQQGEEYARGFSETPGIISDQGVYLANASYWFPRFKKSDEVDDLVTFDMRTELPAGWDSVSQGTRTIHHKNETRAITTWHSPEPMDEIYLVAAKFHEYDHKVGDVDIVAFLRTPDQPLAQKYLDTTGQYLKMYEAIIGPYPYSKFALVENFWETGYGMPSFTLLGPKVIRFPFILHSSYPHELLHNWWGNSVFVDYEKGNWCEGLTVYLADHLIKEQRGQARQYRRTTLQGYTDYVNQTNDFPLSQFRSRFNAASSAIGYGKSMMVYHMLRTRFGDQPFLDAIKLFYKTNRFRTATFEDLRQAFETITHLNLVPYFDQWIHKTGAPVLKLKQASIASIDKSRNYNLEFTLQQTQSGKPYQLDIPVAVTIEGQPKAQLQTVKMDQAEQNYILTFSERPLRIDIDPNFDLFRRLHPNEIPPALSNAFGSEEILILLPSRAPKEFQDGYEALAKSWSGKRSARFTIQYDNQLDSIPADKAVWIFGNENIHKKIIIKGLAPYEAQLEEQTFAFGNDVVDTSKSSVITAVRHPHSPSRVAVYLSAHSPNALPGLGRKLPHYGKYSYLAFTGDEPTNSYKGQWPAVNSPLTAYPQTPQDQRTKPSISLPPTKPLAELPPAFSGKRMLAHVRRLASEDLEGRAIGSKGIDKASHYIANQFKAAGLKPAGDRQSYFQQWQKNGPGDSQILMRNIIGSIPGTDPNLIEQPVILCAHYDHLGVTGPLISERFSGQIHHGADDNASGVAVMLEIARGLSKSLKPARPILFIAFTGEESGLLGSKHFIETMQESSRGQIFAVINLDTVGRLEDRKLKVFGSSSARQWRFIFMGIGFTTGIHTDLLTQNIESGDHITFINKNIPAVHLFSGAHSDYHKPTDTADKIDATGLEKVAAVTNELLLYLSQRTEPMPFTGKPSSPSHARPSSSKPSSGSRRVKTGVMPDFSFGGKGVRASQVSPGSAAQKAGLQPGDIIIKLGPHSIDSLRNYAQALKQFKPNDKTTITYTRHNKTHTSPITLEAR